MVYLSAPKTWARSGNHATAEGAAIHQPACGQENRFPAQGRTLQGERIHVSLFKCFFKDDPCYYPAESLFFDKQLDRPAAQHYGRFAFMPSVAKS